MMSDQEVQSIKAWHEDSYQSARKRERSQTFNFLGLSLEVPPGVMPITGLSDLLGSAILNEIREGDRVLDMGTGNGVNGLLAASRGGAVVAVDINPAAVEATRHNAERNGMSQLVDARVGNVFGAVEGRFDLIVFNPPARWFPARDVIETASTDEDYGALTRFVENVRSYMRPNGRMLILFGSIADIAYFKHLLSAEGFSQEVVAQRSVYKNEIEGQYYVFKVIDQRQSYPSA